MSDSMQTTVIIAFFAFLLVTCFTIIGFLLVGWWKDEKAERASMRTSIDGMSGSIAKLSEKFVLRTDYDRDMALLRVPGRRSSDTCPEENCPLLKQDPRSTRPGVFTPLPPEY